MSKQLSDHAQRLATRIAEDALNRISEEFPDTELGPQGATLFTFFGYIAGMAETALELEPRGEGLFNSAKALGNNHALLRKELLQPPQRKVQ